MKEERKQTRGSRMSEKKTLKEFYRKCPYCGVIIQGDPEHFTEHKRNCPKKPKSS
jgi:hypothetical protein